MQAKAILDRSGWLLADVAHQRFSQATLLSFISDAQRQVALLRPDATAKTAVVQLVPGTLQAIPADGLRLLEVSRCMGADGQTPGQALRLVERPALDSADGAWHAAVPGQPEQYVFDPRTPRLFYVHPPVPDDSPVFVELTYSVAPAELADPADDLAVADVYAGPVLDYALHLAWSMDIDSPTAQARAAQRLEAFTTAMNAKLQADLLVAPAARSA